MNHIEKLNWRYATKKFDNTKKLSEEQVRDLAESLRLAASSFGLQPWKFLVISNEELKKELLPHSWNQEQVVDCSHHIVFCAPKEFTKTDIDKFVESIAKVRSTPVEELEGYKNIMVGFVERMSSEQVENWINNQVYIALGSFLVTCAEMGVDACPMEGIIKPEYDKVLGLEEKGLRSVVACPVGFRSTEDKYSSAPKVRFETEEVIQFL
jgi:nitroreductase